MGIAVLGPLSIDGHEALGRRDRTVLAALAVHPGDEVRTERLYEVLWGETPPASAAKVVQGCVVRLRKVLGRGAIETTSQGYRLAVPGDDVDASRFRRALARGAELLENGATDRASAVLAEALTWWRGDALPELEEWEPGRVEALRLGQLRLQAEELYVESELRRGAHDRVLAQALSLVDRAPLRERRWLLLARAHYQAGRQSEALDTIRRLRVVLAEELGLDAGAEAGGARGGDPAAGPLADGRRARRRARHRLPLPWPAGLRRPRQRHVLRPRRRRVGVPAAVARRLGRGCGRAVRNRQVVSRPRRHRRRPAPGRPQGGDADAG